MKSTPNPITILIALAWISLSGYHTYHVWFDVDNYEQALRDDLEKLPWWYPLRNSSLNNLGSSVWLWQIRILSTLSTFIGIVVLGLALYALFR